MLLALGFAVRRRLAPVVCAAAAVAVALGLAAVAGIRMTAVTAAAAPIVAGIGAGVAVRLQAAVGGTRGRFSPPARAWSQPCAPRGRASGWLPWRPAWPFLMLVFSPAPAARDFGALVVLGLALAVALSLSAGLALLGTGLSPQRWAPAVAAVGARAGRGASA